MERIGYARVSAREAREVFDRQVDALEAAGCRRVFDDRGAAPASISLGCGPASITCAPAMC